MLSRFIIAFLPRSKRLNFLAAVTICSDFGAQENKICHCFHCFSSICHEVIGLDAMILVFLMFSFKPALSPFSRGRSGGLVLPSLEEFSTVYCDPHSQRVGIVNRAEIDVFLELSFDAFLMIQCMLAT